MFSIIQNNITIMVNDLDKSISFYQEILGFKLLHSYGNYYAQISVPGIIIGLHPSNKKTAPAKNLSIGFTVNNFEEAKNHLEKAQVAYEERKEQGGNFIHFRDPDKTPLYFIDPKK